MNLSMYVFEIVPRIRGRIQLVGFLFAILAFSLTYRIEPDNVMSMALIGSISLAIIIIPFAFSPAVIRLIPSQQRMHFLLVLTFVLVTSFGLLAVFVGGAIISLASDGPRFDTSIDRGATKLLEIAELRTKLKVPLKFHTLARHPNESATVFAGVLAVHDESLIEGGGPGQITDLPCSEVSSCLGSHVFSDLAARPILLKGDFAPQTVNVTVDLKSIPRTLRIWWKFYQREGPHPGHECRVDEGKAPIRQGIPPLAMRDSRDRTTGHGCYFSEGMEIFSTDELGPAAGL